MKVSIVIPVYNEEERIAACLAAIGRQTVGPLEVLVVDNNSTDATATIAASFPFVTVLREPRQGVVHARNHGFNHARGDIIGRIDADTLLAPDWVERVSRRFSASAVAALTGRVSYYGLTGARALTAADFRLRSWLAKRLSREVFLHGANMAIRRSVWETLRPDVCQTAGLHEDLDLAIHANKTGAYVVFDPTIQAAIAWRRNGSRLREYASYVLLIPRTYGRHGLKSQRHMYPIVTLLILSYWPLKILHKSHDLQRQRFSLIGLFGTSGERVNPATFVD
jgi:glycosyltransferase involved in cell wall biosynthesis